eukprot:3466378-Lingulodinium_polyedra.AAC.1
MGRASFFGRARGPPRATPSARWSAPPAEADKTIGADRWPPRVLRQGGVLSSGRSRGAAARRR